MTSSEVKEYLVPDPNNPGEMVKKIEKKGSCGCTSKLGKNGSAIKFNTFLDYNKTTFEDVSALPAEPLTTKN